MATKTKNQKMAEEMVAKAQKTLGAGWDHVSNDIRWGLVAANILSLMMGQDEEISGDRVRAYVTEVNDAAHIIIFGE